MYQKASLEGDAADRTVVPTDLGLHLFEERFELKQGGSGSSIRRGLSHEYSKVSGGTSTF